MNSPRSSGARHSSAGRPPDTAATARVPGGQGRAPAGNRERGEREQRGGRSGKPMTLGRASGTMAVGTIVSRASGFLRTVAIAAAIGTGAVGDAYNVANTTPNIVYDLLLGGVLSSVLVPVLVRVSKEDSDGGERFASSLLTIVTLALGATVIVGMLAAPLIVKVYLAAGGGEQTLAVTFLRWFMPQVLFYGVGATIGAILNVRQSFAAPMFTPVLNNVIVIGTCVAFIFLPGPRPPEIGHMTGTQTTVLALGTTLGVVVMTLALIPALRTAGFRYRPRLDLRHPALRQAGRLAGWTLLYVMVTQLGYLVIVRLSSGKTSYTIYTLGYQIFQLPHAIIAVSLITALLPRMSAHAAERRYDLVRDDLSTGMRLTAVALVPAALALLALGQPLAVAIFNHGATSYQSALTIGDVLAAFACALLPFSLFQLQLRAFYAHQDSRTPALVNVGVVATNVVGAVVLSSVLPGRDRAVGLALAFALSYTVGLAVSTALLRRLLGNVDGTRIARLITQVTVAGGLGAVAASVVASGIRELIGRGAVGSAIGVVFACLVGGVVYVIVVLRMRLPELNALVATMRNRFAR
jgi:putative peptidoglycan lipid II flippase